MRPKTRRLERQGDVLAADRVVEPLDEAHARRERNAARRPQRAEVETRRSAPSTHRGGQPRAEPAAVARAGRRRRRAVERDEHRPSLGRRRRRSEGANGAQRPAVRPVLDRERHVALPHREQDAAALQHPRAPARASAAGCRRVEGARSAPDPPGRDRREVGEQARMEALEVVTEGALPGRFGRRDASALARAGSTAGCRVRRRPRSRARLWNALMSKAAPSRFLTSSRSCSQMR